jgi:hypothetical protein
MLTGVSHPGCASDQPYAGGMSWTHILTTHEFWTGGLVVGGLGSFTTYFSTRASDRRKAKQEERMQTRKEEREDKLRDQESLYTAAMDFVEVSTDILVTTIDMKGVFNAMRDLVFNRAGLDDPKAKEKLDHSEKVMDAQTRIAVPVNKLKLVAPVNVLDSAMRTSAAIMTTVRQTTEPFAKPVAHKAAADELNNFYNVFRQEVGREPYTDERARQQALSFMETLKKQVDDFMEEAKADMKAAGFKTTPWDNPRDKSAEPGRTAEEPSFLGPTPLVPVRSLNVGEDISLPIAQRGTGTVGLRSTIRGFNEERTQMTLFVQKTGKTVTIEVNPDQQFIRVAAAA